MRPRKLQAVSVGWERGSKSVATGIMKRGRQASLALHMCDDDVVPERMKTWTQGNKSLVTDILEERRCQSLLVLCEYAMMVMHFPTG